jgi:hypothetical protein
MILSLRIRKHRSREGDHISGML